jgi:hypothetical protein
MNNAVQVGLLTCTFVNNLIWCTELEAGKSRIRFPVEFLRYFIDPSGRTMALEWTYFLTEMSTR